MVRVCVVGCLHGELDKVYRDIEFVDREQGIKTQLILCCGDFQSLRNPADLHSMSVPTKFFAMGDFHRYYSEELVAPILTVFVGGNHEASSYLQELPYGGWVAPNIWFMGYAGVVQFAGLRIAGLSGIYKQHDYSLGHYEHPPYSEATKRSVYHLRSLEVFRLGQVSRRVDVVLSHDWPRGVYHYGDTEKLCKKKPYFREEVETNSLGCAPAEQLLCRLRPRFWFSAHLHCKFAAVVAHADPQREFTKFLALDKCLPSRDYLQFLDIQPDPNPTYFSNREEGVLTTIPNDDDAPVIVSQCCQEKDNGEVPSLTLDPEWMCILKKTNDLFSISQIPSMLPGQDGKPSHSFTVTKADMESLWATFDGAFSIPENFERTAPAYKLDDKATLKNKKSGLAKLAQEEARKQKHIFSNPQTELICAMLELTNPNAILMGQESYNLAELATRMGAEDEEEEGEETAENDDCCCKTFVETPDNSMLVTGNGGGYDPTYPSPMKKAHVDITSPVVYENPEAINLDAFIDDEKYDHDSSSIAVYEPESNPEEIIIDGIEEDHESSPSVGEYNPSTTEVLKLDHISDEDIDGASKSGAEEYNPTTTEVINLGQIAEAEYQSTSDHCTLLVYRPSSTEGLTSIAYKPSLLNEVNSTESIYNPSVSDVQEDRDVVAYHPRLILPNDKAYQP